MGGYEPDYFTAGCLATAPGKDIVRNIIPDKKKKKIVAFTPGICMD